MHGQVKNGNYELRIFASPYEVDLLSKSKDPVVYVEG